MDLVEANDGSASSDPLNSSSDGSTLNGGTNPSHSQASGGINIVHVTLPQAQVNQVNTSFTLSRDAFAKRNPRHSRSTFEVRSELCLLS